MPDWTNGTAVLDETEAVQQMNELLLESLADMQRLIQEDVGWTRIGQAGDNLDLQGLRRISALCRVMSIANPLIKRGLGIRVGYVWGQGVQVSVDDTGADGSQDVNAVVDAFWSDKRNRKTFTSSEAQERLERQLGTHGEVFLALPVVAGGRVLVRSLPPGEIEQIISDPEDADTVWFYLRVYTQHDPFTGKTTPQYVAYPALGYWPEQRPATIRVGGQPFTVRWDAPVRAVQVNVPEGSNRGIPDAFAALRWARASEEFLADWAKLMRALSRIVWQVKTKADKAQEAAKKVANPQAIPGNPNSVGSTVGLGPNSSLEAVPKTGATIDANSGLPLQQMVASALGVPLTMLTGDPGSTGARAVAETLDQPTEHEMNLRRQVWTSAISDICDHVIDQAILAGRLRGTQGYDKVDQRRTFELPAVDSRQIVVNWPEWDSVPVDLLVKAIQLADSTDKVPPLLVFKLLAEAFGVEDIDEWVDKLTDDNGDWIPLDVQDEQVRTRQQDRGQGGQPVPDPPVDDQAA